MDGPLVEERTGGRSMTMWISSGGSGPKNAYFCPHSGLELFYAEVGGDQKRAILYPHSH